MIEAIRVLQILCNESVKWGIKVVDGIETNSYENSN